MTKQQLIDRVAEEAKVSNTTAKRAVDLIFKGMALELAKGERIEIRGFGSFAVRSYDAYKSMNPRTGQSVCVNPKRVAYFRAGKKLRERINGR